MKHLSFFGYGKTTRAIATLLGEGFDFYDDRCEKPWTDDAGNRIHPSEAFNPDQSLMEILTPSIRPDSPLLAQAKNPVSEYDLFLSERLRKESKTWSQDHPLYPLRTTHYALPTPRTVWISGTNGKTTTTQMLTWLLESHGAVSGGNIGTPLAELDPEAPLWILETSSYTLHHTREASPDLYILLPITPDHIDWHGNAENYSADKLSPLLRMQEGEPALIPADQEPPESFAWIIPYDSDESLERFFDLDTSRLRYRAAFRQDALLALAVSRILFDEADIDRLNAFRLDRHRQEEITDTQGRLWVNDSKATNLDATLQALEAYRDRRIHLIAGGDDKGVNMTPLIERLARLDATLYTLGSNSERLSRLAREYGVPVRTFRELDEAMQAVAESLREDEVALLSPAASSLDQFPSYAVRGDRFVEFVRRLRTF